MIPRSCVVKEFRRVTVMKDYEEVDLHIMSVDVPLKFLINNFRDSFAADQMVRKVGTTPWVSEDAGGELRYAKCATSALSVPVRVPANRTLQNLVEPNKAVDHGILVHMSAYQYALETGSSQGAWSTPREILREPNSQRYPYGTRILRTSILD